MISADGGTVLRMQGRRIWQCDPATLEPLRPLDLAGSPSTLSCDGRFCLTDDPGAVWEPASETVLCHLGGSDAAESGLFASASEPVTFHRNGRWLLTGRISVGRSVDLWSGREFSLPDFSLSVRDFGGSVCSPDGRWFLSRGDGQDAETTCREVPSGRPLWRGPRYVFDAPLWLEGGRFVACPDHQGNFEIRDGQTGKSVDTILGGADRASILAVAPDGSSYARRDNSRTQLYERASRKPVFEIPSPARLVRYLPGGRFVAAGDYSGMANVWDLSSAAAKRNANESAADELIRLWPDLAGSDARRAFAASWAFVATGSEAVAFLQKRLLEGRRASQDEIRALVAQLDSDSYERRKSAYDELHVLGRRIIPDLEKAAKEATSPEVTASIQKLLGEFSSREEGIVLHRAGFVLRQIGTLQAEELLAKLGEFSAREAFAPLPSPKGP